MTASTTFLDTALELLSHAIEAEDKHDYAEAHAQYMAAIDYLMAAQHAESDEKSRTLLKTKADEYLNRAETMKQHVDTSKQYHSRASIGVVGFDKVHTTAQSVIIDEAFKCAGHAIDADRSRNYSEAYKQYIKSMDYFMFAQRYELSEQSRSLIRSEVAEYLSRAETIKTHLGSLRTSSARTTGDARLSKGPPRPPEIVFLHTATDITQRAIEQDTRENYQSAYELYNCGLDYFMLAHRHEKNEQTQVAIRASMEEYLSRAEILKRLI